MHSCKKTWYILYYFFITTCAIWCSNNTIVQYICLCDEIPNQKISMICIYFTCFLDLTWYRSSEKMSWMWFEQLYVKPIAFSGKWIYFEGSRENVRTKLGTWHWNQKGFYMLMRSCYFWKLLRTLCAQTYFHLPLKIRFGDSGFEWVCTYLEATFACSRYATLGQPFIFKYSPCAWGSFVWAFNNKVMYFHSFLSRDLLGGTLGIWPHDGVDVD